MSGIGGVVGLIDRALDLAIASKRVFLVNDLAGRRVTTPVPLIVAAQNFTNGWAALGPEISVDGFTRATLWVNVDINDTTDARIRCVGRAVSGGSDFELPIYNPSVAGAAGTYVVLAEGEAIELNDDVDQKLVITWDIGNTIPFIQFQIYAAIPGASPGQILVADTYATYGWGS
jgi:hypothetical protein